MTVGSISCHNTLRAMKNMQMGPLASFERSILMWKTLLARCNDERDTVRYHILIPAHIVACKKSRIRNTHDNEHPISRLWRVNNK